MRPTDVIGWVLTIAADLRLSQAKTLADLVAAAARVTRGTLSALGRCLPGTTAAKHRIKRAWRFCDNPRVHPADVMAAVVRRLTRNRKKPLLVALDWTDIRSFHTLMAAAVMRGRAIPLLWALDRQMDRILAETMEARWARHERLYGRTAEWAAERGITYASAENARSVTGQRRSFRSMKLRLCVSQ